MKKLKKNGVLLFFLLLFFFVLGASFVLAQEKGLEIGQYPTVPNADAPTSVRAFLPDYAKYIFNLLFSLVGLVIFGALVYGGFRYLITGDNPIKLEAAKKQVWAAFLGLIIILCSYLILHTINPQLVVFQIPKWIETKLPSFVQPLLTPGEQTLTATEIPIATMINGASYSEHKGVLDERRMALIREILDEVKRVSLKITAYSQELIPLAAGCNGMNTRCTYDPSGQSTACLCESEPCPNRRQMDILRLKINTLNMALDVFIKGDDIVTDVDDNGVVVSFLRRSGKIRDFIRNFPSTDLVVKSLGTGFNQYDMCKYQYGMACQHGCPGVDSGVMIRGCLLSSLQAEVGSTLLPEELKKDLEEMAQIEEKGGELEQIRREMEKELKLLEEGEQAMRECPRVSEDYRPFGLLPENELSNYREDLLNLELIKGIDIKSPWEIKTTGDPGTFYCTEGLIDVPLMKEEAVAEGEAQTQFQKIGQGEGAEKVTCETEIPLGKTIDDAVTLARNIMDAITGLLNSAVFQIESAYAMTNITNWETQHCGKSWRLYIWGDNRRGCPNLGCGKSSPCPGIPTCPMDSINETQAKLKKNIACLLKKGGELGITATDGEQWMCCGAGPYPDYSCKPTEGPYGRLLKYYEESIKINQQLAKDRGSLAMCKNTAEERTKILLGEAIPQKGVIPCEYAKLACENLEEGYKCYGEDNSGANPNYFCIQAETK